MLGSPADYAPDSKVYLTQLGTGNDIDFLAVSALNSAVNISHTVRILQSGAPLVRVIAGEYEQRQRVFNR